jgi:hypothetical protein
MSQTVIVFQDKATADLILKEIAATPNIPEGIGPVWVWYDPDSGENAVQYAQSADGRCAISHPWTGIDREWLEAYLDGMDGVQVLDELPGDW